MHSLTPNHPRAPHLLNENRLTLFPIPIKDHMPAQIKDHPGANPGHLPKQELDIEGPAGMADDGDLGMPFAEDYYLVGLD
jgi:hypothetical protein